MTHRVPCRSAGLPHPDQLASTCTRLSDGPGVLPRRQRARGRHLGLVREIVGYLAPPTDCLVFLGNRPPLIGRGPSVPPFAEGSRLATLFGSALIRRSARGAAGRPSAVSVANRLTFSRCT